MVINTELDPFRVILGVVATRNSSDLFLDIAYASGLRFDATLSGGDAYSHTTRLRALIPRVISAYDELTEPANKLGAANALIAAIRKGKDLLNETREALRRVGWDIRDEELVVADPDIREMFFPKGSRWDAYVVLRSLFAEASKELVIVDGYCDNTVFELLAARGQQPLTVRILCCQSATALGGEAKTFIAQFSGWTIHIRKARDFHDRFVVIDGASCVHVGASINGAGKTAFMISRVEDPANRDALLKQIELSWSAGTTVS
jgi:hypothetical protein